MTINFTEKANFIWSIAELLRGDYKQSEYGRVVLPFTVLRRLDCVLDSTKVDVLEKLAVVEQMNLENIDPILNQVSGYKFHNRSKYDFNKLIADPENIAANLRHYINGFSENARETFEHFDFEVQIDRMDMNQDIFKMIMDDREFGGKVKRYLLKEVYERLRESA